MFVVRVRLSVSLLWSKSFWIIGYGTGRFGCTIIEELDEVLT